MRHRIGRRIIAASLAGVLVANGGVIPMINHGLTADAATGYTYTWYADEAWHADNLPTALYAVRASDGQKFKVDINMTDRKSMTFTAPTADYYTLYADFGEFTGMLMYDRKWVGSGYTSAWSTGVYALYKYRLPSLKVLVSTYGKWFFGESTRTTAYRDMISKTWDNRWGMMWLEGAEVGYDTADIYWTLLRDVVPIYSLDLTALGANSFVGGWNDINNAMGQVAATTLGIANALGIDGRNAKNVNNAAKKFSDIIKNLDAPNTYTYRTESGRKLLQLLQNNTGARNYFVDVLLWPNSLGDVESVLELAGTNPKIFECNGYPDQTNSVYYRLFNKISSEDSVAGDYHKAAEDYKAANDLTSSICSYDRTADINNGTYGNGVSAKAVQITSGAAAVPGANQNFNDKKAQADNPDTARTLAMAAVRSEDESATSSALYEKLTKTIVTDASKALSISEEFPTIKDDYQYAYEYVTKATDEQKETQQYKDLAAFVDNPFNLASEKVADVHKTIEDLKNSPTSEESTTEQSSEESTKESTDAGQPGEATSKETEPSTKPDPSTSETTSKTTEPKTSPEPTTSNPPVPDQSASLNFEDLKKVQNVANSLNNAYGSEGDGPAARTFFSAMDVAYRLEMDETSATQDKIDAAAKNLLAACAPFLREVVDKRIDSQTDDSNGLYQSDANALKSVIEKFSITKDDSNTALADAADLLDRADTLLAVTRRIRSVYEEIPEVTEGNNYKYSSNRDKLDAAAKIIEDIVETKKVGNLETGQTALRDYLSSSNQLNGISSYNRAMTDLQTEMRQYSNTVYSSRYQNDTVEKRSAYRTAFLKAKEFYDKAVADPDQSYPENLAQIDGYTQNLRTTREVLSGLSDLDMARERLRTAILINSLVQTNLNDKQKEAINKALDKVKNDGDLRALENTVISLAREQNLLKEATDDSAVKDSARFAYADEASKQAYEDAVNAGRQLLRDKSDIDTDSDVVACRLAISRAAANLRGTSPYATQLTNLIDASYDMTSNLKFTGSDQEKRVDYVVGIAIGRFTLADPDAKESDLKSAVDRINAALKRLDGDLARKIVVGAAIGSSIVVLIGYILSLILKAGK
ncbi:MAG: hypothetical protein Q3962_08530 [Corynebacterium sp.]|nr:hypothetical protein [Corynebacterium sp.]